MNSIIHLASGLLIMCVLSGCSSLDDVPINLRQPNPQSIIRSEPQDVTAPGERDPKEILSKAEGLRKMGKPNDALFYYVTFLEHEPEHVGALAAIGQIHFEKQNRDLAKAAFELSLKGDPNNSEVIESLGILALQNNERDQAEVMLKKAQSLNPRSTRALNALGLVSDQKGDYRRAQAFYREALSLDPKNPGIQNNLAYSLYLQGDYPKALAATDAVLIAAPTHVESRMNRSLFLMKLGRVDETLQNFRHFLSESDAYNNLGYLYLQAGSLSLARECFEKAILLSPSYHDLAHQNLKKLDQIEERQSRSGESLLVAQQKP
jgi:Flp pilus assembly protein TadD